jgi:hypothetical protein
MVGRTRWFVLASFAAVMAAALPIAPMPSAGAADPAPAFQNGIALASAQVVRVAPGVGALSLAVATGVSLSQVTNSLAQASAQSIDTGLIGNSLTAEQCNGKPGPIEPSQLPAPTVVDNRKGNASATSDEIPLAGSTLGGGRELAEATTTPSAHAQVADAASVLGPVVSISGGKSDASSRIVDHNAREAEANTTVDLDIAGLIHLHNLHWRAFHRTGTKPAFDGTFVIGDGSLGGIPLPVDQLGSLQTTLNTALAESGITIELPRVEHLKSPNELIRITPLRIELKDSPAGKTVLGPGLNLTHTQREQLFDQIVGVYCPFASELLVGDITLDVLSGTGFLTIDIGGADATSSDAITGNPFGSDQPVANLPALPGLPPTIPGLGLPSLGLPAAPPAVALTGAGAIGKIKSVCESLNTNRKSSCSRGIAVPVGIAAVVLAAGVGYLDFRRRRRLLAA